MTRDWLRLVLVAVLAPIWSACIFDADYQRTRYQCEDGACPSGYACRRGFCEPTSAGEAPSNAQSCGTTELLANDFAAMELDTAGWYRWGENITFTPVEGRLQVQHGDPTYGGNGGYETRQLYLLRDSRVFVEVPDYVPATNATLTFEVEADGSTDVSFQLQGTELRLAYERLDSRYRVATLDHDPAAHRFWQVREAQGTLYWEASADAETWELLASTSSVPFDGLVRIKLLVNLPVDGATPGPVFFDQVNGGSADATEQWCPVASLSDDFNDGLVGGAWTTWADGSCTFFEQDGALFFEFGPDGDGSCGYESITRYDLTGSSISIEVPKVDESGAIRMLFILDFPGDNAIAFEHGNPNAEETNRLVCWHSIAGGATPCSLSYDAATHRWWRFRHDDTANLVHWETSPDGEDWQSHGQYDAADFVFTAAVVQLISDSYGVTGRMDAGNHFDNLNVGVE
jgi:hypothetical protein